MESKGSISEVQIKIQEPQDVQTPLTEHLARAEDYIVQLLEEIRQKDIQNQEIKQNGRIVVSRF